MSFTQPLSTAFSSSMTIGYVSLQLTLYSSYVYPNGTFPLLKYVNLTYNKHIMDHAYLASPN